MIGTNLGHDRILPLCLWPPVGITPDGRWLDARYDDEQGQVGTAIVPLMEPGYARTFEKISARRLAPDGRGLSFVDARDRIRNIWVQPIDGGNESPGTAVKVLRATLRTLVLCAVAAGRASDSCGSGASASVAPTRSTGAGSWPPATGDGRRRSIPRRD